MDNYAWDQQQQQQTFDNNEQQPFQEGAAFWLGLVSQAANTQSQYNFNAVLPPMGHVLDDAILSAYVGVGTQNYTCQAGQYKPAGAIATLYSTRTGERAGHHLFNSLGKPVFELDEYGYVVGEVPPVARTPSGHAGSVDDLLLAVMDASGQLRERGWSFINRVLTTGGKAPAQCTEDRAALTVPYTAYYLFYHRKY